MALISSRSHPAAGPGQRPIRALFVVVLGYVLSWNTLVYSATPIRIIAIDAVALPGQAFFLEASLYRSGVRGMISPPVGGEVLRFYSKDGELLGEKLTDVSGTARIVHKETIAGMYHFAVRLLGNQRYQAEPAEASFLIRNPTNRLFLVETEETLAGIGPVEFLFMPHEKILPTADSNKMLSRLPRQYDIVYLTALQKTSLDKMRQWLKSHDFPKAPLWPAGDSHWKDEGGDAKALTEAIGRIWKDRRYPAYVVLTKESLARGLSEKKMRVFLLDLARKGTKEERKTCNCKDVCHIQGWKEIEPCVQPNKSS